MSYSGRYIFCGSDDKHIHAWDSLKTTYIGMYTVHPYSKCLVGHRLTQIYCHLIQIQLSVSSIGSLNGHENRVTSICMAPNGMAMTSCSWDQSARVWG